MTIGNKREYTAEILWNFPCLFSVTSEETLLCEQILKLYVDHGYFGRAKEARGEEME